MKLSDSNKIVLNILANQYLDRFVSDRDKAFLVVHSDEARNLIVKTFNQKFSACLQIKKICDSSFNYNTINTIPSDYFLIFIEIIEQEMNSFNKLALIMEKIDPISALNVNNEVYAHVAILKELVDFFIFHHGKS